MDRLPSNIMFDILSRLPGRCLARSRCVSKLWCEYIDDRYLTIVYDERVPQEPIPILYHTHLDRKRITRSLCFHRINSEQTETGTTDHTYVLELKEDPCLEFLRKKPLFKSSDVDIKFRGSCNGLMCLSQTEDGIVTTLVVVHPLRKECYELPPLPMCRQSRNSSFWESCGLGFDASTNTLKMVCVLFKDYPRYNLDMVRKKRWIYTASKDLCTMVHVFGTNTWREIPQVPLYPMQGNSVFVNGCLHWLVNDNNIINKYGGRGGRPVIWFDVEKEEFGMIDPHKNMCDLWKSSSSCLNHLVDLNGEVGYVCFRTKWVWKLKQKEWVPHWRFGIVLGGYVKILGCWNKDGDMLVRKNGNYSLFVYNLKSRVLHQTNIVCPDDAFDPDIFMHPNKLFSIHGIGTNSFAMRKTVVKESCQRL